MDSEQETKGKVLQAAQHLDYLSAMGLPRNERRRLAKINGGTKIVGSTKPYIRDKARVDG